MKSEGGGKMEMKNTMHYFNKSLETDRAVKSTYTFFQVKFLWSLSWGSYQQIIYFSNGR